MLCTGCAVRWYEKETGTEHIWGLAHMKMKVAPPNEGVQSIVTGVDTVGFNVGAGQDYYGISLGWDSRRRILVSSNAAVRFEWPSADFFTVRVGTKPPFAPSSPTNATPPATLSR